MNDGELARQWSEILDRLDRHGARDRTSPDVATLPELMDTYRIPGLGIAVAHDDGRTWSAGYGTTGADAPTPVGPDTAFQACSISKHVAAFGALRLVDGGVLDLDADIGEYLTTWRLPAGEGRPATVTLRQLLAHTAGLSYNWFRGYGVDGPAPTLLQTLEGRAPANTPPVRPSLLPGSRFRYSGSHYAVLQQLMVDVTGARFDALMQTLVLDPVSMVDSSFDQRFPHRRPRSVASGHHRVGTAVPGGWRTIPEMAGAGLWSTPTDLLRLELEIARAASGESELLGRDLATQMLTPQLPGGAYGLGTELDDSPGRRRFGHTGDNVGYSCFSFAWPDAGAAVAVMTNSEDTTEVRTSILTAAERRYAAARAAPPGEVTGRYLLRDDFPIDVAAADGGLSLTAAGQSPAILVPLRDGGFRHPGLDLEVRFQRDIMELRQEGVTQTATRTAGPSPGEDQA
ncbi:serine hydrolase domain-containing protein [Actinoplanes sp. NPDC049118]|uniref:serine hydrolase domain-containing protein n=1 Tax=Actinoplanes sp. NPDC049118 TaxID=3155769 RepID=UPI0033E663DE